MNIALSSLCSENNFQGLGAIGCWLLVCDHTSTLESLSIGVVTYFASVGPRFPEKPRKQAQRERFFTRLSCRDSVAIVQTTCCNLLVGSNWPRVKTDAASGLGYSVVPCGWTMKAGQGRSKYSQSGCDIRAVSV